MRLWKRIVRRKRNTRRWSVVNFSSFNAVIFCFNLFMLCFISSRIFDSSRSMCCFSKSCKKRWRDATSTRFVLKVFSFHDENWKYWSSSVNRCLTVIAIASSEDVEFRTRKKSSLNLMISSFLINRAIRLSVSLLMRFDLMIILIVLALVESSRRDFWMISWLTMSLLICIIARMIVREFVR